MDKGYKLFVKTFSKEEAEELGLLYESNLGDGGRDFAPTVLTALSNAGFSVTVTSDYTTPFQAFDVVFTALNYPELSALNNTDLIAYVSASGGVYLAGGVGDLFPSDAPGESASWDTFLANYGLSFAGEYNPLFNVSITSAHPIFAGVGNLGSGNGQSIIDLGTDPNADIVQFVGVEGVYAVVVPEPGTALLLSLGLCGLVVLNAVPLGSSQSIGTGTQRPAPI